MSDFLSRLVERNQSGRRRIRPRLGSLFEPAFPAEMTETQSIQPDASATPPPALPTPDSVPRRPVSTPVQQVTDPAVTVSQSAQAQEAILPPASERQTTAATPDRDESSAIPPIRYEHRRRTIVAGPAMPMSPPASEPSPSPDTTRTQDSASAGSLAPATEEGDLPKSNIRLGIPTINPTPPDPIMDASEATPLPHAAVATDPSSSPVIVEPIPAPSISPRREIAENVLSESTPSHAPMTPRMQPMPPFTPPAPEPPTIQVTIGRIDVRAQTPERHQPRPPRTRTRPQPALSLDDYLKQRGGSS